ncbi:crotonobetainyl-CoA:carnitine CoA-transferase CaiB-like acyl-CoA transferase [Rhodobium orientis]|uniref:Formyl-CoA transferase n=1 Tax=Rhodobium orientis TaxID=34017 RepID=A0A327JSR5_9HYPH|nr:CaiB/BaiF CoA-transferase family protein [Rhodobium orientis]MBB4303757.1 crotonobetainyl-CoA:carnitine CoA-transferase CaiB-like acyl-CoA transferase [Rhodobium orientis]MBK5951789.1 formyl-CoA transferase [Rhodobium orientis]RAI28536.1 formyl-CoA transferase [Rhodobium orientis]
MGPLDSLRVIELGQLIAGPFCGQLLADFGADVIKVEPPKTGDVMRQWGRPGRNGDPVWWSVIARGKRSVTLDLRTPEGQDVLRDLVAEADVLIENFRPGTMERWGLGFEALSDINPRLIMARVSGFGQDGPYAARAGFASVCEAMGGMRHISGYPDRPPVRIGLSLGDSLAGMNAAMGILLALERRHVTGRGQVVDSSIFESVLGLTESIVAEYDAGGHIRERHGSSLPGIAPSNAYPTRDGKEMIIGANQDAVFGRLCQVMGVPELADDPRYATHRARGENAEELDARIAEWTRKHAADRMIEDLAAAGVPVGLAYTARDMMADPHFAARRSILEVDDPRHGGTLAMQNVFPRLSESPGTIRGLGPELGADTGEVLQGLLGYSAEKIAELEQSGII